METSVPQLWTEWWVIAPAGAVVIALGLGVAMAIRRRKRRLAMERLEVEALRLLDARLPDEHGQEPEAVGTDAGLTQEVMPLHTTLVELGRRMRSQIKDVAKKSRNLEALIDAIDEPIVATDDDERVLLCNRSAVRLFGSGGAGDGATLIGRAIGEVFTSAAVMELHRAARGGATRRERVSLITPLGRRIFQVTASPVPAAWGAGVFGAVLALRDVTELDMAMQMKTDFVANASHELRTPVAAIRGAAETMAGTEDDPAMTRRLREMIASNAERLQEMLRDLSDLSRLETPEVPVEIETVDVTALESEVRGAAEERLRERGLTLVWFVEAGVETIRSDRKLLGVILRNLVENATKFAFERTPVRVSFVQVPSDASSIRISVEDQGQGIPLHAQERVFERYYQVDPGRGSQEPGWKRGTGLGLAIVKHAARALGGKAELTSVWGQGTTVWVEVPR